MMLKKHVITGAQCTGKTTTVEDLRKKGFRIVEEASRIVIEEQNKKGGDLVPWKRLFDFNETITSLQMELESQLGEGTHFLDRGMIDNFAYCEWGGIEPPQNLKEATEKIRYNKIFLLEPLIKYEKDPVRKESREDQLRLHGLIKKAYQERGYEVVEVPPLPVKERTRFILKHL